MNKTLLARAIALALLPQFPEEKKPDPPLPKQVVDPEELNDYPYNLCS